MQTNHLEKRTTWKPVDVLNCMGQSLPNLGLAVKEVNGKSFRT